MEVRAAVPSGAVLVVIGTLTEPRAVAGEVIGPQRSCVWMGHNSAKARGKQDYITEVQPSMPVAMTRVWSSVPRKSLSQSSLSMILFQESLGVGYLSKCK